MLRGSTLIAAQHGRSSPDNGGNPAQPTCRPYSSEAVIMNPVQDAPSHGIPL
jgi:hypothetical protein